VPTAEELKSSLARMSLTERAELARFLIDHSMESRTRTPKQHGMWKSKPGDEN